MNNNVYVKGVFSTEQKAKDFIKKYALQSADDWCDDSDGPDYKEGYIEKEIDRMSYWTLELDKDDVIFD